MSKDSSAGGGASVGFAELLRMNPELFEQMQQSNMPSMPAETQAEQAMIRTTTPDAIASFYGSGDEIVQPDQSYFQDFALPGVQMERPDPAERNLMGVNRAEVQERKAQREAERQAKQAEIERRRALAQQRLIDLGYEQVGENQYQQGGSLRAQGLLGYQQSEQVPADEGMGVAPSMPILDFAGGNTTYMGVPDFRNLNMRGMR